MFFTTFTPGASAAEPAACMAAALAECGERRDALVKKIGQVPFERADNLIKQAEDTLCRLQMAGRVGNEVLLRGARRLRRMVFVLVCVSGVLCAFLHQLYAAVEAEDPFSPAYQNSAVLAASLCLVVGYASRLHLVSYYEDILRFQLDDCFVVSTLGPKALAGPHPSTLDDLSPDDEAVWHQLKKTLSLTISDFRRLKRFSDADWAQLARSEETLAGLHGKAAAYRAAIGSPWLNRSDADCRKRAVLKTIEAHKIKRGLEDRLEAPE